MMINAANKNDPFVKDKNRRIKSEVKKLSAVMKDVPEDMMIAADGLIQRAAFMRISLEDYEENIKEFGHTELFSQSDKTEPYDRERPVVRLYNSMVKNYNAVMIKLFDFIPDKPADNPDPAYNKFFGGKGG